MRMEERYVARNPNVTANNLKTVNLRCLTKFLPAAELPTAGVFRDFYVIF